MGMRQFNYCHVPGKVFVFATEVGAVLAHSAVPRRINEGRIADFLDNLEGLDLTSTFFQNISRLPPAHLLTVDPSRVTIQRYWQFESQPELRLSSDTDYDEAFLDIFREAVRCRLRSSGPVGVFLSGGIDSNAVASVAAGVLSDEGRPPLFSYSGVGPDGNSCVESAAIRAAARNPGVRATLVDYGQLHNAGLNDLAVQVSQCAEPFDAPMSLHRALYIEARKAGVRVMLDGVGGDLVFNAGNVVGELIRSGRIGAAVHEARWEFANRRRIASAGKQLLATAWTLTMPKAVRRWRRTVLRKLEDRRILAGRTSINPRFARATSLDRRRKQFSDRESDAPAFGLNYRLACLFHPHLVVGRERYDRVSSAFGIEKRDPVLDLRVFQF
jgi:asparagine synthase (glutamine-hydrolysing)